MISTLKRLFGRQRQTQAIAVVGMHRSGTSCLTGLLENAGAYLGDVSKKNPYNLKGNQERKSIMDFHNEVLEENDAAWNKPPATDIVLDKAQRERLGELIRHYEGHEFWAFKDPRSLFLLGEWQQALPGLKLIGTLRHPLAVATSLNRRDPSLSIDSGMELWLGYNRRLLVEFERSPFPIVDFNLPRDAYLDAVCEAIRSTGIKCARDSLDFFDDSLRKSDDMAPDVSLPEAVADVYSRLLKATEA